MIGQGRPFRRLSWLVPVALGFCAAAAGADTADVRVRIASGGGAAGPGHGTVRINDETQSEVTPLRLEPDAPGSMLLQDRATIRIFGRTPRSYDGCDVRVQAPTGARLLVQLNPDLMESTSPLELPLAKVVHDFTQFNLDDRGNRLLAQRSPGDVLRVTFTNASLVFSPSERFELDVQPQLLDLTANTSYVLAATLGPARTEESVWSEDFDLRTDQIAQLKSVPVSVPLPEHEGVYDLRLSLFPKRLVTTSLVRGKALATRKVQLVVVAPVKNSGPQPATWQSILEFDPASPTWWERMSRLPSWARLPVIPQPVGSGPAGT